LTVYSPAPKLTDRVRLRGRVRVGISINKNNLIAGKLTDKQASYDDDDDDDDEGRINFTVVLSPKTTRTRNNKPKQ